MWFNILLSSNDLYPMTVRNIGSSAIVMARAIKLIKAFINLTSLLLVKNVSNYLCV